MFKSLNSKAYIVGGAVRDTLLGKTPEDYDYVIEATEEEFRKVFPNVPKVGNSFPVFLIDGNEVALTRTERCIGNNYQSYELTGIGVTIEEDLMRRDISINSIARNYVTGEIIDPCNGVSDIKNKVIRCTNTSAFVDDPLRMYRAVRFNAILEDFEIEDKTFKLIQEYKDRLQYIFSERVEKELQKMYKKSNKPSLFFNILLSLDALKYHFKPFLDMSEVTAGPVTYHYGKTAFEHTMDTINRCKEKDLSFSCFISVCVHDFGKGTTDPSILPKHIGHEIRSVDIAEEWFKCHTFDSYTQKLALSVAKNHMAIHRIDEMRPYKKAEFFKKINRDLKKDFINSCCCDFQLSDEKLDIWNTLIEAEKTAIIEVPKKCKDPRHFVIEQIAKRYQELLNAKNG